MQPEVLKFQKNLEYQDLPEIKARGLYIGHEGLQEAARKLSTLGQTYEVYEAILPVIMNKLNERLSQLNSKL